LDLKKRRRRTFRKADCVPEVENGWRHGIECPRSRIEASRDFLHFILFGRSAQRTQLALCVVYSGEALLWVDSVEKVPSVKSLKIYQNTIDIFDRRY
jgi:hypothetical protein